MKHEKENPVALAGAHRAENIKSYEAFDGSDIRSEPLSLQVAIIARRHRLSPCMARLVCHLAAIGGRLA